jgi:choline-glycine betaine transporter
LPPVSLPSGSCEGSSQFVPKSSPLIWSHRMAALAIVMLTAGGLRLVMPVVVGAVTPPTVSSVTSLPMTVSSAELAESMRQPSNLLESDDQEP